MQPLLTSEGGYRLRASITGLRALARRYRIRVAAMATGLAALAVEAVWGSRNGTLGILGGVLAAIQIGLTARDVWEVRRAGTQYYFGGPRDLSALNDAWLSDRYEGFARIGDHDGGAIWSTQVNLSLWGGADQRLHRLPSAWVRPPLAEQLLHFVLKQRQGSANIVFNAPKVSLRTDITTAALDPDASPIVVQETDYFSGEVTNELSGQSIVERATGVTVHDGRQMALSDGVLRDLCETNLSNHIGVSSLAVTSDGHLVLALQSPSSAQSATAYAPSGSGSVDLADLGPAMDLQRLILSAAERELGEECGIPTDVLTSRVLGHARLLHRGGKPEFFTLTRADVPLDRIRVISSERAFISTHRAVRLDRRTPVTLRASLTDFAAEHARELSFLLRVALRLLDELLEEQADEAHRHLVGAPADPVDG